MSDLTKAGIAGSAIAAVAVVAAAIGLATGAKSGEAVDVLAIVVQCDDAGTACAKTQVSYRCVVGGDAGLDCGALPEGAVLVPGTASKPYAATKGDSAKAIAPEEQGAPCACAPWGGKGCEALVPSRDAKAEPAWAPAPAATVLQPGQWRGDCLACACYETSARTAPGSTIRKECRAPAAKVEAKSLDPLADPAVEAGEVRP